MSVRFCGHCGEELGPDPHTSCDRALELEPPRFCAQCRRRMVVQVTPTGWTARCSSHGEVSDLERSHGAG
jgi:hypothetical protein